MSLATVLRLSQLGGYIILVILSLCMIVPLSMNVKEFCGHCLLFTTGKWPEDGTFDAKWSSNGFCNFPLVTGIVLFVISSIQIYRSIRTKDEPSFLMLFIDVVLGVWMLAMSILSAIMITLGFIVWCNGMTQRFEACEIAAGLDIFGSGPDKIDTSGFYIEMGTAQFGAWGSFATSVGVGVISLLKLINNHQIRNIKVSMYLERQRLVNQHQIQHDGRSTPPICSDEESSK